MCAIHRFSLILLRSFRRWTLIKSKDDVGTDSMLDLYGAFGSKAVLATIDVRTEGHALVIHFCQSRFSFFLQHPNILQNVGMFFQRGHNVATEFGSTLPERGTKGKNLKPA